jgi:hypothetical protein
MFFDWRPAVGPRVLRIKPAHTLPNKCVVVSGASRSSGAPIIQYDCSEDNVDNDLWNAESLGVLEGRQIYQLRNLRSSYCIAVKGGSTVPGAELIQYPCNQTENSQWILFPSI